MARFGERALPSKPVSDFFNKSDYGTATGGTETSITVSGNTYRLLTFTSDGTLTVTKSGVFDVLLVGGGGAISGSQDAGAGTYPTGGGGGGQVIESSVYLNAGSYTVDVGAGGTSGAIWGSANTSAGRLSSIGTVITAGGGDGSDPSVNFYGTHSGVAGSGGSGAGMIPNTTNLKATPLIGANIGGNGASNYASGAGGGGGGADGAGGNASGGTGGAGGNGKDISSFIGGSTYYAGAGGGGGATTTGGAAGNGGVAGTTSGNGNNGSNYGAGGGGTKTTTKPAGTGGNGAAGVVYVRFR